jgi:DNA polymerase
MDKLYIDIETRSTVDLKKSGLYRYAEQAEILMIAYAVNDEDVQIEFPPFSSNLLYALKGSQYQKIAWNASFELTLLSTCLKIKLSPDQWRDTMIRSVYNGRPMSLKKAALSFGLEKLESGTKLIKRFNDPNAERSGKDWEEFVSYCINDVDITRKIDKQLIDLPQSEWNIFTVDQIINSNGLLIDVDFVKQAIVRAEQNIEEMMERSRELTGLENPNSVQQLGKWLGITSITKDTIAKELETAIGDRKEVLELRQHLAKSSIAKYQAMKNVWGRDNRVRGLFQYYGAPGTGRWSSRLVQLQSMPRNGLKDLYETRKNVLTASANELSQLIRSSIISPEGKMLSILDFSSIEPRLAAWLVGDENILEIFRTHGKLYEAMASTMFKVNIEDVTKEQRSRAKTAQLACSYAGGLNSMKAMGGDKLGMTDPEMSGIVTLWRSSNPLIVDYWKQTDTDAKLELVGRTHSKLGRITYNKIGNSLYMNLPSGRSIAYYKAKLVDGNYGGKIIYEDAISISDLYGGKLFNAQIQGMARDVMAEAMVRISNAGYKIIATVHDEILCEIDFITNLVFFSIHPTIRKMRFYFSFKILIYIL